MADAQARLSVRAAASPLVGTWRLVRWESTTIDGAVMLPFGEHAVGLLLYAADGSMMVSLMRESREPFSSGDLMGATAEEKAQAAADYISYGGRWELRGDTVRHHVEVSLNPSLVGRVQKRGVELDGDRLTLSTGRMVLDGVEQTARLTWRRAG